MTPSEQWYNRIYFRWTVFPILAHIFSWMTGWSGIALFPILVTVAQYLVFKIHPAVARPGFWFFTLPITFFIWVKWGPYTAYLKSYSIQYGIAAYYAGQCVNALFIPLIIRKQRPDFLLNWILSNLVAAVVWLVLYKLVMAGRSEEAFSVAGQAAMFIIYPAIGLIANGVSGFFLTTTLIINRLE